MILPNTEQKDSLDDTVHNLQVQVFSKVGLLIRNTSVSKAYVIKTKPRTKAMICNKSI